MMTVHDNLSSSVYKWKKEKQKTTKHFMVAGPEWEKNWSTLPDVVLAKHAYKHLHSISNST